jgi:hypothetical protein
MTTRTIWLLTYRPLAATPNGPWKQHPDRCLPYEDASCRREPDFRAKPVTISGACRPGFAARLKPGDLVVYATVKRPYDGGSKRSRKLVAILEVHGTRTHANYALAHSPLPANCIVPGNAPLPWELTEGYYTDEEGRHSLQEVAHRRNLKPESAAAKRALVQEWDRLYKWRQRHDDTIVPCDVRFLSLERPPEIPDNVFSPHPFPGTQSGTRLTQEQLFTLLNVCDLARLLGA